MDIINLCALLALRRLSPTFILPLTPFLFVLLFRSEHVWTDGWSNTFTPTTLPCVNTPLLDEHTPQHSPSLLQLCSTIFYSSSISTTYAVKIFVTPLNIILLQSPNPISKCLNILFVSEFQRFARSPPRFKSFYLAFKIFIIITMFCTHLIARRRVGKLSLTPLLSPSFPIHGRTDGWSNTASPTTPPYPYRVYLAMSTLKCPISLCSRYFMTCTTLFYFIVLQLSYIVEFFFDTLPNVTLLFRFKDIIHAQSFKCLFLCTLNATRRRPKSPRAPLLFTFYRAPAVSDFHDLSNTSPFSPSPTSNSPSTTDIKLTERPTPSKLPK